MSNLQPKKKPHHKFVRLSSVGLQLGITIYLAAYFGKKLDIYYGNEKKYITILLVLLAFVFSMISLLVQLKRINKEE